MFGAWLTAHVVVSHEPGTANLSEELRTIANGYGADRLTVYVAGDGQTWFAEWRVRWHGESTMLRFAASAATRCDDDVDVEIVGDEVRVATAPEPR